MSWLRRCLLHRINLRRPHAGEVIFYVRLSGCDKPQPIIHPLQQVRCGGNKHISHFSFCPLAICLYSLGGWGSSLPQAYPGFHQLLTNTHFIFSFSFFLAPHGGPTIFPRGAHFSQTVMNGSGSCIDFQTETI